MTTAPGPDQSLDRRGRSITTFVVHDARARLEAMDRGQVLEVLTDDFEPFRADIDAWCRATGNDLVHVEAVTAGLRFLIAKGATTVEHRELAMVISTDGLEELLSPLGFALAAALEGMPVHLFFQGPAVRVLRRGFTPRLSGWARPFSRFARAQLADTGHLPPQDKLRQLRDLGAHISLCGPSMQHFKVDPADLVFDDLPLIEYLSFMAVMEQAHVHVYT